MRSLRKINQAIKCFDCGQIVNDSVIKVFCQHEFHQGCFLSFIEKQINQGTKIKTNILRLITNEDLNQRLLYNIFSSQLQFLLKHSNLRKNNDYQQIKELSESNTDKEDQIIQIDRQNKKNIPTVKVLAQDFSYSQVIDISSIIDLNQAYVFTRKNSNFCALCKRFGEVVIEVCYSQHFYHEECFIQWMEKQIVNNKSGIIYCICEKRLKASELKNILNEQYRMALLNYLYSNQLWELLYQLRNKEDLDQIMELFYKHYFTIDQDYKTLQGFYYRNKFSTQKQLI